MRTHKHAYRDMDWGSLVCQNKVSLRCIPEPLRTPELCVRAVRVNPEALDYVPDNIKTPEFCMMAVKRHWQALKFVPEQWLTEDICMAALLQRRIRTGAGAGEVSDGASVFTGSRGARHGTDVRAGQVQDGEFVRGSGQE